MATRFTTDDTASMDQEGPPFVFQMDHEGREGVVQVIDLQVGVVWDTDFGQADEFVESHRITVIQTMGEDGLQVRTALGDATGLVELDEFRRNLLALQLGDPRPAASARRRDPPRLRQIRRFRLPGLRNPRSRW